jgi:defect-in-organelle-trafficking protein DotB
VSTPDFVTGQVPRRGLALLSDSAGVVSETADVYPHEPAAFTYTDFEQVLRWGVQRGMSDLKVIVTQPLWMRVQGRWVRVTRRALSGEEINALLTEAYRSTAAAALLQGGHTLDWDLDVRMERGSRLRFRCNATLVAGRREGVSMTFRVIPADPPPLEAMQIEPALLPGLLPLNGLVLVTGVMGSGKSTLLASVLRRLAETQPRSITTFESPIEFDYSRLQGLLGPVEQSSVGKGRHLESFVEAVRSASRRACDVVLVGEARDAETLRHMIELAEMGPAVYSTVHTRGVAETPGRIVHAFAHEEQPAILASLLDCLRCVVQQRLLPSPAGGRTAVREFLILDQSMRDELAGGTLSEVNSTLAKLVESRGQTLLADAHRKLGAGLITEQGYKAIEHERSRG